MSYSKHNYRKGDELLASQLNEMDDQILINENATQTLIEISDTEPSAEANRIWIKETSSEIEIPMMEDYIELKSEISALKNLLRSDLIPILQAGTYTSDQSEEITALSEALKENDIVPSYSGETLTFSGFLSSPSWSHS